MSTNNSNGNGNGKDPASGHRNAQGQFEKGWCGGPGNPFSKQTNAFRAKLYEALTEADFAEIVSSLIAAAKAGEPWAVKEILDRTLGRPVKGMVAIAADAELAGRIDYDKLSTEELTVLCRIAEKLQPEEQRTRFAWEQGQG